MVGKLPWSVILVNLLVGITLTLRIGDVTEGIGVIFITLPLLVTKLIIT